MLSPVDPLNSRKGSLNCKRGVQSSQVFLGYPSRLHWASMTFQAGVTAKSVAFPLALCIVCFQSRISSLRRQTIGPPSRPAFVLASAGVLSSFDDAGGGHLKQTQGLGFSAPCPFFEMVSLRWIATQRGRHACWKGRYASEQEGGLFLDMRRLLPAHLWDGNSCLVTYLCRAKRK